MKYPLYTYKGIEELRKIQAEMDVVPFVFQDTAELLQENPKACIDITALVYYLNVSKDNRYPAYNNLRYMTDETLIIADEEVAENAISLFPTILLKAIPYLNEEQEESLSESKVFTPVRKPLYTYDNSLDLSRIIEFAKEHSIPIATFSQASSDAKSDLDRFNKAEKLALLDLSSVSLAIEGNKNLIYLVEVLLNMYPNIQIVSEISRVDTLLESFPLYIEGHKKLTELIPDLDFNEEESNSEDKLIRVTDLNNEELYAFFSSFEHNLIGHINFKKRLKQEIKHFIALNKVKEQKVLSIFLYGPSGIGKTEVARLIANGLREDGYFAKISFQNYSSQDALNSLIGSPAGYIGCEHGELSDKIAKTKIGVLLCDEFEKTTRPVFLFFLELLEEGYFTDSMAREYDMDGFVIVFTSNIQTENDYKKTIPPELQTRFDLVCEFEQPTTDDKRKFLHLLLEKAMQKHSDAFSKFTMQDEDRDYLIGFDCSTIPALRDIKRVFNNRLMDLFESKGL